MLNVDVRVLFFFLIAGNEHSRLPLKMASICT